MTGLIDFKTYIYGHGIVSQNCLAKEYCDGSFNLKRISTGTFVQVKSIRDDDVLFRVVNDDTQVETNDMICKQSDIISVPENLLGPLFTLKKSDRLTLVRDNKVAESLGNISVGHTVQVLDNNNSVICLANVTFRNSIDRLGIGIYFGLQILTHREHLKKIIEAVSVLEPGTKGFPRGCDIVVKIDRIYPSYLELEKSIEKEYTKFKNSTTTENIPNVNYKSTLTLNLKDKSNGSCLKDHFMSSPNSETKPLKKIPNSDNTLNVGDEVVYLDGDIPVKGVVRCLGLSENHTQVKVEFKNPIGRENDKRKNHFVILSPMSLIKLSDYQLNSSNSTNNNTCNNINISNNLKITTNNNNNRINNNNVDYHKSGDDCSDDDEIYKKQRRFSSQIVKRPDEMFESGDGFHVLSNDEIFNVRNSSKGSFKSDSLCHNSSKSFDLSKPSDKKVTYRRHYSSVDNGILRKDSNSISSPHSLKSSPISSHDLVDSFCPLEKKSHKYLAFEDEDSNFHKSVGFSDEHLSSFQNQEKELAKKSKLEKDSDEDLYDVPPAGIRRASCFDNSALSSKSFGSKCSYKEDFYSGRRHTLAPAAINHEINEFSNMQQAKWDSQYSEHSSSDENLSNFCETGDLGVGSVVEIIFNGEPYYGVIRWIGMIHDEDNPSRLIAGVEMEEESPEFTDGTFNNKRYFQCNPQRAVFVPLSKCRKDSRFSDESHKPSVPSKVNYGQIDCPIVEGTIPPINVKGDIESFCGKNRGIQGHHNSCYLDATLFSMFAFTSVFDSLLYRPPSKNDIPQYSEVQRVLREEIVNPLRKNQYVRADRVMKLRTLLENLSSVSGLTSEEKDPEEFLNSLLAQILKAEPFLKLSSGQEAFHYQLFVEKDERLVLPSVQQLFEQSFVTSDIKLKQVPSCLIIQMPRFGKSFKMYSRILPPQLLDITDILENSPRQCTVCGKLAEYECKDCFGQQGIGIGLESISFCKGCLDTAHNHHHRSRHNSKALKVPLEFYELQEHCVIPRLYMELFAVVCIETSHYVAFVKCGSGSDAPWCFFDSMADRKGEQNGYNIPEMVPCPDLPYWLSEEGSKTLNEMRDERQLPDHAKRLFSDAYMCMYQSPDLMMYR